MLIKTLYCKEYKNEYEIDPFILTEMENEISKMKATGELTAVVKTDNGLVITWDYKSQQNKVGSKLTKLFYDAELKAGKKWMKTK